MEVIFEILFELVGEILLQVVFEALASAGIHLVRAGKSAAKARSPWMIAIGYALFGAIAGGISLWVMPDSFLRQHWLRIAYLVVVPLLVGALFAAIARWRDKRGLTILTIDRFSCGWLFALAFAGIRYAFAH